MPTSWVKTNLFLTFEIAAKWQNVGYTRRSCRLISLNQSKTNSLFKFAKRELYINLKILLIPKRDIVFALDHKISQRITYQASKIIRVGINTSIKTSHRLSISIQIRLHVINDAFVRVVVFALAK